MVVVAIQSDDAEAAAGEKMLKFVPGHQAHRERLSEPPGGAVRLDNLVGHLAVVALQ